MKKDIERLLSAVSVQNIVVELLEKEGYITVNGERLYKNCVHTKKSKDITGDYIIPKEILEKYQSVFPVGKKSSIKNLQENFNILFREHPDWFGKWELIRDAILLYIDSVSEERYIKEFRYLILKTDLKTRVVESVLEGFIEQVLREKSKKY